VNVTRWRSAPGSNRPGPRQKDRGRPGGLAEGGRLPAYAPDLNPAEGVWSVLKRGLSNLAVSHVDDLATLIRSRLKPMQYRPALIDGFLAETGLTLNP
jgi:hypothetical protein